MNKEKNRKKKEHSLHLSTDSDDFLQRLQLMNINLEELIHEFVHPEVEVGVLLGGSIPEKTATSVSDVDISLLIRDPSALKDFKNEILGQSVFYLHRNKQAEANWAVLFICGVEINFEIKICSEIGFEANASDLSVERLNSEDVGTQRFLSRITSGWPLYNKKEVELWRDFYCVEQLKERKIISEFTLAIKELEDMKYAIGTSSGLVYILGVHIVTRLIKSILASQDYYSPGVKWMRKVNQLISLDDDRFSQLLESAKHLLFPEYKNDIENEKSYYMQIVALIRDVEIYVTENSNYVGEVVDWVKDELDLVIE